MYHHLELIRFRAVVASPVGVIPIKGVRFSGPTRGRPIRALPAVAIRIRNLERARAPRHLVRLVVVCSAGDFFIATRERPIHLAGVPIATGYDF